MPAARRFLGWDKVVFMSGPDDPQLLERVAVGDPLAVRAVIERYGDLVWSLARRFTDTEADAEEAVQDIFMTLWRKSDRFDPSAGAEVTFVSVLARRLLIDRWRRESKRPKPAEIEGKPVPDLASARLETDELAAHAREAFAELDEATQHLLRLSVEAGCSHAIIADICEMPLGTVKSRIRAGLTKIRDALRTKRKGVEAP